MTPSQARNAIKKSLKVLVDPKITKADKVVIWQHFENCCAYCGCGLNPNERKAHIDHVIPESEGGSNRLCNLILTCPTCNGDEKRDMPWQEFLTTKYDAKSKKYKRRYDKIMSWFELHSGSPTITNEQQAQLNSAFDEINASYSKVVEQIKQTNLK
jgi:CRISPR/Cas system Type II protein with McrA/HNH and RuvC-like nuclease domain